MQDLDLIQDAEILIDGRLLRDVTRRRLRAWMVIGPLIFLLLAGYQLLMVPQQFTATVSIAVQQTTSPASPLAALAGMATTSNKYIGILHSRLLAETVESKYHLQQFYHIPTHRKAVEMLMAGVKPQDNPTEGLLFVDVSLPGPPRFAPNASHQRAQIRQLVADVANTYAAELRHYYATSDNDRDSVLLTAGDTELRQARASYDATVFALQEYIRGLRNVNPEAAPTGGMDSGAGLPTELMTLYEDENKLEAEIRATEATRESTEANTKKLLSNLNSLPTDDPFLSAARDRLQRAQTALDTLRNAEQLSDDHPAVVQALSRVRIAQQELVKEEQGYRKNLTSDSLLLDARLQGLYARRQKLLDLIHQAAGKLPTRREKTAELLYLQQQQEIALARLKTAEEKGAELRLSAVSGKSRLSVVDSAIPPEGGTPGIMRAILLSLLVVLLLLGASIVIDYFRQARRRIPMDRRLDPPDRGLPSETGADVDTPALKR